MPSTSWFDIQTVCNDALGWRMHDTLQIPVDVGARDYPEDITASVKRIHALIRAIEARGVPSHRIFVGGFSQVALVFVVLSFQCPF